MIDPNIAAITPIANFPEDVGQFVAIDGSCSSFIDSLSGRYNGTLSLPPKPSTTCDAEVMKSYDQPLPFALGSSPLVAKGLIYSYTRRRLLQEYGDKFYETLADDLPRMENSSSFI